MSANVDEAHALRQEHAASTHVMVAQTGGRDAYELVGIAIGGEVHLGT